MLAILRPALVLTALFSALLGLGYPLAITGVAQVAMPGAANGSLIRRNGEVVGSALIGQAFTTERYFHPRPSATSAPDPADATKTVDSPYNAANSSGSNLGPTSDKLLAEIRTRADALGPLPVPADLVTASASGLDPHISPEAATLQVARVAAARGRPPAEVKALVRRSIDGRIFGILGEPRINVLRLNLALDEQR